MINGFVFLLGFHELKLGFEIVFIYFGWLCLLCFFFFLVELYLMCWSGFLLMASKERVDSSELLLEMCVGSRITFGSPSILEWLHCEM